MKEEIIEEQKERQSDLAKTLRLKVAVVIAIFVIGVALIVLLVVDTRTSGALIEKPMIKVFDKFPTDKKL